MKNKRLNKTQKLVQKALDKWLAPLGLKWWGLTVVYYRNKEEIKKRFVTDIPGEQVAAITYSMWKYMEATIRVNLLALAEFSAEEVEIMILHELMHILVNEMREKEIHHEERVCTTLAHAFNWVRGWDTKE